MVTNKVTAWAVWSAVFVSAFLMFAPPRAFSAETLPVPEAMFPQLERILSESLRAAPRMLGSNLARLQSFEESRVSALQRYPSVRAYSQYSLNQDKTAGETSSISTEKFYYSIDLIQPLYHWGALQAGARIGQINAEMARNNMIEAYRLLALEIRRDFLQLVILKQGAANARFQRDRAVKQRDVMQARIDAGEVTAGMLEPAENAIVEAELGVDRSEFAFENALERFRRLCGDDGIQAAMIPDEIPPVTAPDASVVSPLRINYVEKGGADGSVRARNAELGVQYWNLQHRIARTALRPKVDLVLGSNQDERTYTLNVEQRNRIASLYLGVRVSWNIFDSHANRHRLRASQYRVRQFELQASQVKDDLLLDAKTAATELDFTRRALKLSERSYALSAGAVAIAESLVESGRGAPADVDAARSGELAARVGVFQARAGYLNAAANFLSLVDADPAANSGAKDILNQ